MLETNLLLQAGILYKGLYLIQYRDGTNLNRDDASGFWLDILAIHSQYSQPVVTMHMDYTQKYPSVLQIPLYNFTPDPAVRYIVNSLLLH